MRVLYVASNPNDQADLNLEREITELQRRLITSPGDQVLFEFLPALKVEDLPGQLRERKPDVLHLAAHGDSESLSLAKEGGARIELTAQALLAFLPPKDPPRIIYLNACKSHEMAQSLVGSGRVNMAIGSTAPITNGAARAGAVAFYEGLLAGYTVAEAFNSCQRMVEALTDDRVSVKLCVGGRGNPAHDVLHDVPVLVAEFKSGKPVKNRGCYKVLIGITGCPRNTVQVVFFTNDEDFITDQWALEDDLCSVVRENPTHGEIWIEEPWETSGDFRIFAMGVKAGGGSFALETTLCKAIENKYRSMAGKKLPVVVEGAIKDLQGKACV
jgi:hypothetical protein